MGSSIICLEKGWGSSLEDGSGERVRIIGLKQEGGEFFFKDFQSIEGRMKDYEELINGKSVQPNIKLFLSLMQKINRLFLRNIRLFLSAFYKNKVKVV